MISRDELEDLAASCVPPEAGRIVETFEALCAARVGALLREGKFPLARAQAEDALPERARMPFRKLLDFALERGLLKAQEDVLRPTSALLRQSGFGEAVTGAELALDPIGFQWLCRGLDALGPVLRGSAIAEELLFPGGNLKLATEVYARSAVFSFYSRLPREIVSLLAGNSGVPLRVLEVGGGIGATARSILSAVEPGTVERYFCTDIARGILAQAQREPSPPELSFGLYDIDRPDWPVKEKVDLILAINVLHLSADPEAAADRLMDLLSPGGSLIVAEISPPEGADSIPWIDFTFGLLSSFHRTPRPGGPLLRPEAWKKVLAGPEGAPVHFIPLKANDRTYGGVYVRSK